MGTTGDWRAVRTGAIATGVAVLGMLANLEVLGYWFTGPDTIPLIVTSRVQSPGDALDLLAAPLMHGTAFASNALFFRPVPSVTYAVDFALWGPTPMGYHLTDLLLHGVTAACVFLLVRELSDDLTGGVAGVVFALHPLSVEVVPSPARRHDVLATLFVVLTVLLFVRSRHPDRTDTTPGSERRWTDGRSSLLVFASAGATLLALGSKETAVVVGPLLAAWFLLEPRDWTDGLAGVIRHGLRTGLPYVVVTLGCLVWRIAVLGGVGGYVGREPTPEPVPKLATRYARSLLYPVDHLAIHLDLSVKVAPWGLLILGLLFAPFLALAIRRRSVGSSLRTGRGRALAFFVVWLVVPFAVLLATGRYAVRVGYLSVVPVAALVALLLVPAGRRVWHAWRHQSARDDRLVPEAGAVLLATVLCLSVLAGSPLFGGYDGWEHASDVSRESLAAIETEVATLEDGRTVVIDGLPHVRSATVVTDPPRPVSVTYYWSHTVASWVAWRHPAWNHSFRAGGTTVISHRDVDVNTTTTTRDGNVVITVRYPPVDESAAG